ncbi:MAG: FAD-dependent oxidoreductase [Sphaerochaetaceae bacterium]|nr:FAD-dependent oxidoreductase [Sphaerochaetaceae bacterium]
MVKKIHTIEQFIEYSRALQEAAHHARQGDGILVCSGGGCIASGSMELIPLIEEELERMGLSIPITCTGCLGPCSKGPVISCLPDGAVYEEVTQKSIEKILTSHFKDRKPYEPKLLNNGSDSFFKGQQKIVLRNCGKIDPLSIEDAIGIKGYHGLVTLLKENERDVIEILKASDLRGRGGAGFPTWLKWHFTKDAEGKEKYVLCNADEGDPGAYMDRSVLEGDPHSLIEGMAIAALTIGAQQGFVYVRAEYPLAVTRLQKAIDQALETGLLGDHILGTDFSFTLEIRMGSGAFVCGEETALMNSIEGKRGEPRTRPPYPAIKGLWGKPTLLNNVETYANIPAIITEGATWYSSFGSAESRGTKVFALAGAVSMTGLVEVPLGTPLGDLIFDIGGGIQHNRPFKAAQIGGPSGGCIPVNHLSVPLDYEPLKKLGAIIGSGGLIVMDDTTCMVDVARYFLEFVQEESCGRCVPCRVGTKRMLEILTRICEGEGREGDIEALEKLGHQIKDTALCGLGQTAPNPVLSTIRHFRGEYEAHIRDKHCEAGVCAALVRASCQSACPAHVDIPGFVWLTGEGRYAEALKLHRERNPFAAVCARVCFHTCEDKCRRMSLDEPVSIRGVKRFLADQEITMQVPEVREDTANAQRKIAIIGAGPAGLSCAYFLARLGYKPTVFEAASRPGGMLVQTIPAYRLPRETLAREIRMIENLGVDIRCDMRLGSDFTFDSLKDEGYEKFFLAVGSPESLSMNLPGETLGNVVQAVPFLQHYNLRGSVQVGHRVAVIGGGNAAIDAARTALRLGAESVRVIYRRSRDEMPAYAEEVEEALLEGVEISCLTQPVEIIADRDGNAAGVTCLAMDLGGFDASGRRRPVADEHKGSFTVNADQIIIAIGQRLDTTSLFSSHMIDLNDRGFISIDPVSAVTSDPDLFAGGDCTDGPSSVVEAIAAGERAAVGIDISLTRGNHAFWRYEKEIRTSFDPDADPSTAQREPISSIPIERRRANFEEVELPWTEPTAHRQAHRCLRCDYGKQMETGVEKREAIGV